MSNTQMRMIEDKGQLRERKKRHVLTQSASIKAHKLLKDHLFCTDKDRSLWAYADGWSDEAIAQAIGFPECGNGVARLRQTEFGTLRRPPSPPQDNAPAETKFSTKDAIIKIMERLDKIEAAVEELARAFR